MAPLPRALSRRASFQHGVVSRDQLREFGLVGSNLHRRVERRELVAFAPNVFRFAGSPVTYELRLWAALLDAGPDAALSHRTAGHMLRYDGCVRPDRIEVTVLRPRHLTRPDTIVHRTVRFARLDVVRVAGFPCTSPTRTLLDLACVCGRSDLERAVDAALRDRLTSEVALRRRLDAPGTGGFRGRRQLRLVLDGSPGLHSMLERAFFRLVEQTPWPRPRSQVVFRTGTRFVARVDFLFQNGLVVEVSGYRTHATRRALAADADRRRAMTLAGIPHIEFTGDQVFRTPDRVRSEVGAHLDRLGWAPAA